MGSFVFKDAVLVINSVDLSSKVRSVTLNYAAELQVETAMGDNSQKRLAGLKDWSINVTFKQDFAASQVDDTLFSLIGAAAFPVSLKPTSAATSATNPSFAGNAVLETYPPLGGGIGVLAETSVTFQGSGDLARNIV